MLSPTTGDYGCPISDDDDDDYDEMHVTNYY